MRLSTKVILLLLMLFSLSLTKTTEAQLSNIKGGLWSEAGTWQNNTIPTYLDDVILQYDIIIDINSNCRSLNSNGHTVTVNSGVHFEISAVPTGGIDDSILSKVILIDTTILSGNDTVSIQEYTYDGQRRLEQVDLVENYKTPEEYSSFVHYLYNGNDSLPNGLTEDDIFIHYRFYTAGGLLTKDSVNVRFSNLDEIPNHTNYYGYQGDSIFLRVDDYEYGLSTRYDTAIQTFLNGNVVAQKTASDPGYEQIFQLDDHPNPMYKSKNYFDFNGPIYSGDSILFIEQQKNNYTQIKDDHPDNTHKYAYQYVYKQNGYPLYFRSYNISSGLPVYAGTGIYKYTK